MKQSLVAIPVAAWLTIFFSAQPSAAPDNLQCETAREISPVRLIVSFRDQFAVPAETMTSRWYHLKAVRDGVIEAHTDGSNQDTSVCAFRGMCGALEEISCANEEGGRARISISIQAGERVLLQFQVLESEADGTLVVNVAPPPFVLSKVVAAGDQDPLGGKFARTASPAFMSSRQIAFEGTTSAIFLRDGDSVQTVAASGEPTPIGGVFQSFRAPSTSVSGVTAFAASVSGGEGTRALFRWVSGQLSPVIVARSLSSRRPSVNAGGDVAFSLSGEGVFVASDGGINPIFVGGDESPCGGTFRDPSTSRSSGDPGPRINDSGLVAFRARGESRSLDGVFLADTASGIITAIVCEDGPTPIGGTFNRFGRPALNNLGELVFEAEIRSQSGDSTVVLLVSDRFCPPPGLCVIANGAFRRSMVPAINDNGVVTFSDQSETVFRWSAADGRDTVGVPCRLGRGEDEPSIDGSGRVIFREACNGRAGIFGVARGEQPVPVALHDDATLLGTGFAFTDASASPDGLVAMRGTRTSVFSVRCSAKGCGQPKPLLAPPDPVSDDGGGSVSSLFSEAMVAERTRVVTHGRILAADERQALFVAKRGHLRQIVAVGDEVPGASGQFLELAFLPDVLAFDFSGIARPAVDRRGNVAFLAGVDAVTAGGDPFSVGLFLSRRGKLSLLARDGQEAPAGLGALELFTEPSVSRGWVAFGAVTTGGACVFLASTDSLIEPLACAGDLLPPPVGGALAELLSAPVQLKQVTAFRARVSEGAARECLFRRSGSALEPVVCQGDVAPLPGGETFEVFEARDSDFSLVALGHIGVVSPATTSETGQQGFFFFSKGRAMRVAMEGDALPPPLAGTLVLDSSSRVDLHGNHVLFNAAVLGGPAGSVVLLGRPSLSGLFASLPASFELEWLLRQLLWYFLNLGRDTK